MDYVRIVVALMAAIGLLIFALSLIVGLFLLGQAIGFWVIPAGVAFGILWRCTYELLPE